MKKYLIVLTLVAACVFSVSRAHAATFSYSQLTEDRQVMRTASGLTMQLLDGSTVTFDARFYWRADGVSAYDKLTESPGPFWESAQLTGRAANALMAALGETGYTQNKKDRRGNWIKTDDFFAPFNMEEAQFGVYAMDGHSDRDGSQISDSLEMVFNMGTSPGSSGETFVVFSGGTPTPIPGAVWLLGSGLVGLVGIRRRMKK